LNCVLNQKYPIITQRKRKVILLPNNVRSRVAKIVKDVIGTSMESFITRIHQPVQQIQIIIYFDRGNTALLTSTKHIKTFLKNDSINGLLNIFFIAEFICCQKKREKVTASDGQYFE